MLLQNQCQTVFCQWIVTDHFIYVIDLILTDPPLFLIKYIYYGVPHHDIKQVEQVNNWIIG